jgi:hypothetical protein
MSGLFADVGRDVEAGAVCGVVDYVAKGNMHFPTDYILNNKTHFSIEMLTS